MDPLLSRSTCKQTERDPYFSQRGLSRTAFFSIAFDSLLRPFVTCRPLTVRLWGFFARICFRKAAAAAVSHNAFLSPIPTLITRNYHGYTMPQKESSLMSGAENNARRPPNPRILGRYVVGGDRIRLFILAERAALNIAVIRAVSFVLMCLHFRPMFFFLVQCFLSFALYFQLLFSLPRITRVYECCGDFTASITAPQQIFY